ncbi:MAG: hypothetical protein H6709_05125 [Kofleriaceae bacterium]|nr:hypothetical protein [Myxococcales bacterium]MCB9559843.1 hypothetical protein [Kofleriaceae bacterium]MCB9571454.1 hypothetical protein [Kofleriaceae bacterium]
MTCPGCGVAVAIGYPRCPKCHAALPQPARSRRATARDELLTGGTSVEPSGGYRGLALIGVVVLGLIVAVVVMTRRGGDRGGARAPSDDRDDRADRADDRTGGTRADDVDDLPELPPATQTGGGAAAADPLAGAIRDLSEALRTERLWSKVSHDGTEIVVESSLCGDTAMHEVLAQQVAPLHDAGARSLRCQEPHGGLVFETDL